MTIETGPAKRRRGQGEGGLYRRESDGLWVGTVDLGYVDGKRKRRTVYATTQKAAAAKVKAERTKQGSGVNITAKRETLGAYLARWLADVKVSDRAPKTIDQYDRLVTKHLIPDLGHVMLDKLTASDVNRWLRAKRAGDEVKKVKPLAPKTCNHLRGILRAALNQAIRDGLIARNPVAATKPVKGGSRQIDPLTTAEMRTFLATVAGDPNELLYRVTLTLGLRLGEALGLTWANVDLDGTAPWAGGHPALRIEATLQRIPKPDGTTGSMLATKEPKTPKSRRTLTIPPQLVPLLKAHRKAHMANAYVFTTPIGTPIDPRNALRGFHDACNLAGIPRRRFHDLRHTAVTAALAQGIPLLVVSRMLGHSQLSTTSDTYAHILNDDLAAATETLGAWVTGD